MAGDSDRVAHLEHEVERLEDEVERYRAAIEDALQQLDWCIGYFVGCNKGGIATALGANRSYIRQHLLRRAPQRVPLTPAGDTMKDSA